MIYSYIAGLIQKAINTKLITEMDQIYVQNQVIGLLHIDSFPETIDQPVEDSIPNLLDKIIGFAVEKEIIMNSFDDKEILSAKIMNCFVAHPSVINDTFNKKYNQSPKAATDYFYGLSKNSNYIQVERIRKNIEFKTETEYGPIDITINLSKPEKDPEQIKQERSMKQAIKYPKCLLCVENEGYIGRIGHPARANHRGVRVPLLDEDWFLQYSPYVYYNEHSILLAEKHRDMRIDKKTFERLLTFTEKFPHYFIGSNADLPIVGGSILSHNHYQAGRYEFAMSHTSDDFSFNLQHFPAITASVLKWPLSVIRLKGRNKETIVEAAGHILSTWKEYNDELADIKAFSGSTPHNTITPIARIRNNIFELDLVLRNNRTTEEHPLGIFHPHADVHHIKKENIGLIEVMGLAVLPARLQDELAEIKQFLLGRTSNVKSYHLEWAKQIKSAYGDSFESVDPDSILRQELGKKFVRVLEDAGVFKQTAEGKQAFKRFIQALNI